MAKKILIVEDERILNQTLSQKLKDSGFIVISVFDGQEALDKIKENKPDLILLDIILPVLDGISVLKYLKTSDENKHIPVVVLTNLNDDKKVEEALKEGATDYLIKVDYDLNAVLQVVKHKLNLP